MITYINSELWIHKIIDGMNPGIDKTSLDMKYQDLFPVRDVYSLNIGLVLLCSDPVLFLIAL